ncbi:30S ribosomal protein S2 [uncultured bacterium]|nr:30S ribosomal protein S2 [uncultured bacterium]
MRKVHLYDSSFEIVIEKSCDLLTKIIGGDIKINSNDFNESISELSILAQEYGLQYGFNYKLRRCNSQYILKTENGINIINLEISFKNLFRGLVEIQKSISEFRKFIICGSINIDTQLSSILHTNTWVPGTLTNSTFTLNKYNFGDRLNTKNLIKNSIPISLVLSLSASSYKVISREVLNTLTHEIIFDISKGKRKTKNLQLIGLVDTNVNTIEHTNIINVCFNSSSRYLKKLMGRLLNTLFNCVQKKQ